MAHLGKFTIGSVLFADSSGYPGESADLTYLSDILNVEKLKANQEIIDNYISPSYFAAHQNDWNPTGLSSARIIRMGTTGGNYELRGIVAQSSKIITLINVSGGDIKIVNESITSTAPNRFILQGDISVKVNQCCTIWYDPVATRWRALSFSI